MVAMETMRFAFVFFSFFEDAEKRAAVEGFTAKEEENIMLVVLACVKCAFKARACNKVMQISIQFCVSFIPQKPSHHHFKSGEFKLRG